MSDWVKFILTVEVPIEAAERAEERLRAVAIIPNSRLTRAEFDNHGDYMIQVSRKTLKRMGERLGERS